MDSDVRAADAVEIPIGVPSTDPEGIASNNAEDDDTGTNDAVLVEDVVVAVEVDGVITDDGLMEGAVVDIVDDIVADVAVVDGDVIHGAVADDAGAS